MSGPIQNNPLGGGGLRPETSRQASQIAGRRNVKQLQPNALQLSELVADEISMAVAGAWKKPLKKRKLNTSSRLNKAAGKSAEEASNAAHGILSPEELLSVFEKASLTAAHDEMSLLASIERDYPQPSQQECALKFLEDFLEQQGLDDELREIIHNKRQEIDHQFGESIRADFNVQPKAEHFEKQGLGPAATLRSFYRDQVIGYKGPEDVLGRIRQQFGESRVEAAFDFLMQGLGVEMSSATPSTSTEQLKAIIDDLSVVEATRNLNLSLKDSLSRASTSFGFHVPKDAQNLLSGLLGLRTQRWIDGSDVDRLIEGSGARSIEEKLYMAREFRQIVRELPETIFNDHDEHTRMNDAMQSAMDRLIEQEGEVM